MTNDKAPAQQDDTCHVCGSKDQFEMYCPDFQDHAEQALLKIIRDAILEYPDNPMGVIEKEELLSWFANDGRFEIREDQ